MRKKQVAIMTGIALASFLVGTLFNLNYLAMGDGETNPWNNVWQAIFKLISRTDSLNATVTEQQAKISELQANMTTLKQEISTLKARAITYDFSICIVSQTWSNSTTTTLAYGYQITYGGSNAVSNATLVVSISGDVHIHDLGDFQPNESEVVLTYWMYHDDVGLRTWYYSNGYYPAIGHSTYGGDYTVFAYGYTEG